MKLLPALLLAITAPALFAADAAPQPVESRITAATVYVDRAVVTRIATIDLTTAGPVELSFDKLPALLLDDSLQIAGRGTADATLLDVTARETYLDFTPNERVNALEEQLRELDREDRTLGDRITILHQQRDYVLKIQSSTTTPPKEAGDSLTSPNVWLQLLTFTEEQLGKIAAESQTIDRQREDLKARRAALEQQLHELRGDRGRSYKTVTVRLTAESAGQLELTLRYTVPAASWTPRYDARVTAGERNVQFGYFGMVRQNTGEDWTGVELTLSTARPSLGGAAPELQPWIVQQQRPLPATAASDAITLSPFAVNAEASGYLAKQTLAGTRLRTQLRDVASATTVVETQATSATFRIPVATDIPSDNAPHKVGVTTVPLQAGLRYRTTPKLLPSAFLTAEVTNSSDYPLLAGPMNVFLDDTFVATSALRTVMPNEKFDLALGVDEGIAVTRKLNNRFTEDTGVVSRGKRITYDVTITVQNNKRTAETIVVQDHVPVSRHEKIVIKVLAPDERTAKPDHEGLIKWTLDLKPGEKRDLPLKFSVEHPNDLPVAGLE